MSRWWGMAALVALLLPTSAHAADLSELLEDASKWDERSVVVRGEFIGDYGRGAGRVWVQLNDDAYAAEPLLESGVLAGTNLGIGVLMPEALFDPLWGTPGRFGVHGPIVEVTGVFRHRDPLEGGETYIEATRVVLIHASRPLEKPWQPGVLLAGIGLLVVAAGVALDTRRRIRRRRLS